MGATQPARGAAAPRYPLKPDPYSSHSVIAQAVRGLIGSRGRSQGGLEQHRPVVLDVGCGSGPLGALLAGAQIELVGVDADPELLDYAGAFGYSALHQVDLEGGELPAAVEPADIIVFADVLEHCRRPDEVLARLLDRCLRPGGTVIVSLPNVAHWYVRAQLLAGRWRYADRGILDRTHLRFFTRDTGAALLAVAGVHVARCTATPLPLPVLHRRFNPGQPLFPLHRLSAQATRWWPTLLAYQFVFCGTYAGSAGDHPREPTATTSMTTA